MASPRFRLLLASCLVVFMLRLSNCQQKRECDCNAEDNLTYVCLLRCGRGSSGGSVVVLPIKKSPVPSPFRLMQERFALNRDRSERETPSLKTDTNKLRPSSPELLQRAVGRLRELLSRSNDVEPRDSPCVS